MYFSICKRVWNLGCMVSPINIVWAVWVWSNVGANPWVVSYRHSWIGFVNLRLVESWKCKHAAFELLTSADQTAISQPNTKMICASPSHWPTMDIYGYLWIQYDPNMFHTIWRFSCCLMLPQTNPLLAGPTLSSSVQLCPALSASNWSTDFEVRFGGSSWIRGLPVQKRQDFSHHQAQSWEWAEWAEWHS